MSQTDRQKRLRLLVRKLNRQRKQQASKIDILCNNLISAQRAFLNRLHGISFTAQFYKSLLGVADLNELLARAGRQIQQELPGAGVSFFLRQADGCVPHTVASDEARLPNEPRPEDCFHADLVVSICKSNRSCSLDDMFSMGLDGSRPGLSRFSMVTLPLHDLGRSLGFILLYRRLPRTLTAEEVHTLSPVICGLSQAIHAARDALASAR
jgi:hypothetical protein